MVCDGEVECHHGLMQKQGGCEMVLEERGTGELSSDYDFLDYWTEM